MPIEEATSCDAPIFPLSAGNSTVDFSIRLSLCSFEKFQKCLYVIRPLEAGGIPSLFQLSC